MMGWARVSLTITLVACGSAPPQPSACPATAQERAFDSLNAASLAGEYELTLYEQSGARPGARTSGTLVLNVADSSHAVVPSPFGGRGLPRPLVGWTDADLRAVDGAANVAPASRDPEHPGVMYLRGALQLGYEPWVADGISTSLAVERVGAGGFTGQWSADWGLLVVIDSASGVVDRMRRGGVYCAVRRRAAQRRCLTRKCSRQTQAGPSFADRQPSLRR